MFAEGSLRVVAMSAIAAVILIFAFVAKEALPLLFSSSVHKEVTLRTMWTAQLWPGYDAADHIWQPVSEIPKFGIWPLIVGTLKVTHRRDAGRRAAGRGRGALRLAVRVAPRARDRQADRSSCWPACRRWCSASSR